MAKDKDLLDTIEAIVNKATHAFYETDDEETKRSIAAFALGQIMGTDDAEGEVMDEAMLQEFYLNKQRIKELTERNEELIAEQGLKQTPVGQYREGRYVVDISPNVRFDPVLAEELFPIGDNGENMELYTAAVDPKKAKQFLSAEDYARCQKEFPNNKVEVRLV